MAWMRKKVTIPTEWAGQQIKLYFEAVAGATEVYINKEKVGENFDLFLPFSIDITDKVNAGCGISCGVLTVFSLADTFANFFAF